MNDLVLHILIGAAGLIAGWRFGRALRDASIKKAASKNSIADSPTKYGDDALDRFRAYVDAANISVELARKLEANFSTELADVSTAASACVRLRDLLVERGHGAYFQIESKDAPLGDSECLRSFVGVRYRRDLPDGTEAWEHGGLFYVYCRAGQLRFEDYTKHSPPSAKECFDEVRREYRKETKK